MRSALAWFRVSMKFNQRARMLRRNGETKSCDPVNRSKHLHTFSWRGRDAVHLWSLINDALQSIWDYEHSTVHAWCCWRKSVDRWGPQQHLVHTAVFPAWLTYSVHCILELTFSWGHADWLHICSAVVSTNKCREPTAVETGHFSCSFVHEHYIKNDKKCFCANVLGTSLVPRLKFDEVLVLTFIYLTVRANSGQPRYPFASGLIKISISCQLRGLLVLCYI